MHQPAPDPRTHHALARLWLGLSLLAVASLGAAVTRKPPPAEQTPEPPPEAPGQQDTSAPAEDEPRPVSGVVS